MTRRRAIRAGARVRLFYVSEERAGRVLYALGPRGAPHGYIVEERLGRSCSRISAWPASHVAPARGRG
jgi:hypothetical protein